MARVTLNPAGAETEGNIPLSMWSQVYSKMKWQERGVAVYKEAKYTPACLLTAAQSRVFAHD